MTNTSERITMHNENHDIAATQINDGIIPILVK